MARDYDISASSVSGFTSGKGKGRIAGMAQGMPGVDLIEKFLDLRVDKQGAIKGSPIGIEGKVRSTAVRLGVMADRVSG